MRSRIVSPKSTGIMPDTGEETASTDCVLALITNRLGTDFDEKSIRDRFHGGERTNPPMNPSAFMIAQGHQFTEPVKNPAGACPSPAI